MKKTGLFFKAILAKNISKDTVLQEVKHASGGCISNTASLWTNKGCYFVKWGQNRQMYLAEETGLRLLAGKSDLKVPRVINAGEAHQIPYILMEMIPATAPSDASWQHLGAGLAQLHQHTTRQHGLNQNNFIGALVQENEPGDSWTAFFIEKRLEVQLKLAVENQLMDLAFAQKFRKIYDHLNDVLPEDEPSLLHGDLWSGNVLATPNGKASIIDPAVYYGSREIEIAFTHLFGGFNKNFYKAYADSYPLATDFNERIPVYNLYPLLVHANMFGASYLRAVEDVIRRFG